MKKKHITFMLLLATPMTCLCTAMDLKINSDLYRETLIHMNGENLTNEILNTLDIYETHTPELKQGSNLFFIIDGENGLMPFGFGNKIFRRINSSANHNNCLLYSIIRNDIDLLTKIMGDRDISQNILSQPECANVSPEDAQVNGIIRRSLQPVRKKIFDDIKLRIDEEFWSYDDVTTLRILLNQIINDDDIIHIENNITYKGYLNFPSIASATAEDKPIKLLDFLYENKSYLDIGFGLIISLLYEEPIIICHPNFIREGKNNETYAHLAIQSFPNFMPQGTPIFIYQKGGHYQKLTENLLDNGSIYLDLPNSEIKNESIIQPESKPQPNDKIIFTNFDHQFYLGNAPLLTQSLQGQTQEQRHRAAEDHYINHGRAEGRPYNRPIQIQIAVPTHFDHEFYLGNAPLLTQSVQGQTQQQRHRAAEEHYINHGRAEGRPYRR